jgi:hypothetical protein
MSETDDLRVMPAPELRRWIAEQEGFEDFYLIPSSARDALCGSIFWGQLNGRPQPVPAYEADLNAAWDLARRWLDPLTLRFDMLDDTLVRVIDSRIVITSEPRDPSEWEAISLPNAPNPAADALARLCAVVRATQAEPSLEIRKGEDDEHTG